MHPEQHTKHRLKGVLPGLLAISAVMTGTHPAPAQPVFTPGLVKFEMYDLSDRDVRDLSVSVLTSHPTFPNRPAQVMYLRSMDTTYAFPNRTQDQYGSRMTALFVPPVSGNWIFYLRSDDASELWFNPNGSDPAGRMKVAEETECCGQFGKLPSPPMPLVAGQQYYIETLHREGPEYDYCQVAAKLASDPTDPDFLLPISYAHLGAMANPAGAVITSDPARSIVAVLPPNTSDPILLGEDFHFDNGGFTVSSTNPIGPWTYSAARGTWMATGHRQCSGPELTMLNSPPVTVEHGEDLFIVFAHRYSFQYDGLSYDGGQLRMSVNGGPHSTVPAGRFVANGYTGIVQGGNALNGQEAFVATRRGHQSGFFTTSVARLGRFNPGDTVSVQFRAAWDNCTPGTYPDWEIDSVWITHTVTPVNLHAAGSVLGVGSVPVAHTWQMDEGSGFVDLGIIEEILWLAPTARLNGARFRAFLAIPGNASFSEIMTLRLTREPICRIAGPYVATCAPDRPGLMTQVDASGSTDPDGERLTFAWAADTPGVTFEPPGSATPFVFFGAGMTPRPNCTISVTVTDEAGASVSCSTVVDTTLSTIPPSVTLNGGDQNFVCDGSGANLYVEPGASAVDACGGAIEPVIGPTADTRRKGNQVVTYDATDVFGNRAPQAIRNVTVAEPDPILINLPGDLLTECRAAGGTPRTDSVVAAYLAGPAAFDGCDADETVQNDAPNLLPLGTTRVTWRVWDGGPTNVTASANITVQDTLAPTIDCAPLQLAADGSGTLVLPNLASRLGAADACTATADLIVVQTPAPGTVLGLGVHNITLTLSDRANPPHSTTCTTTLEVTADQVGGFSPDGCGAPACAGNGPMSLTVTFLGMLGIKLLFMSRRRK